MDTYEIAPLKCPSCGGATTAPSRPMAFGAEFSCARCGTTSVLVINRALFPADALQKSGDQVCAECGRVAKLDARFCQDGHKLVRTCVNRGCSREFPASHQRCDYCGWPQDVKAGTPEGYERELDIAVASLADAVSSSADLAGTPKYAVADALRKIHTIWSVCGPAKKRAVPSVIAVLSVASLQNEEMELTWRVLAAMGADAAAAVPLLLARATDNTHQFWHMGGYDCFSLCKVLAMIAPNEALHLCRNAIETSGRTPDGYNESLLKSALATAAFVGKPSIPMLLEFCGLLSGRRGTACQQTASEISSNGRKSWNEYGRDAWIPD